MKFDRVSCRKLPVSVVCVAAACCLGLFVWETCVCFLDGAEKAPFIPPLCLCSPFGRAFLSVLPLTALSCDADVI